MAFSSIRRFFTRPNPTLFPDEFAKDAKAKAAQSQAFIAFLESFREWVVGLGEAVILAVFFRVAAAQTHNLAVYVLSILMTMAVSLYVGLAFGKIWGSVYLIKRKWLRVFMLVPFVLAFYAAAVTNVAGTQISRIIDQIAKTPVR
jgi:hypothetical protein